jgi:ABC-2 type transport system permease protein
MYDVVYIPVQTVLLLVVTSLGLGAHFTFAGLGPASAVIVAFIPVVWGLGILSAAATLTFRKGSAVVGLGSIVLMATSSTYFPVRVLPGWLGAVAHLNPLTIALGALRRSLLGGAGWGDVYSPILVLIPTAIASLLIGFGAFRLALRRELRRGTLGLY